MYKPRASAAVKSALCPGTASWAATRSDWLASTHSNLNFGAQNWLLQMLWRDNKKSCLARGRTETTRREPEQRRPARRGEDEERRRSTCASCGPSSTGGHQVGLDLDDSTGNVQRVQNKWPAWPA
ncbi:unnamed protein product [Prorocentrum cordatum]|nr:unnamed protein product [Polarella glacialis]